MEARGLRPELTPSSVKRDKDRRYICVYMCVCVCTFLSEEMYKRNTYLLWIIFSTALIGSFLNPRNKCHESKDPTYTPKA